MAEVVVRGTAREVEREAVSRIIAIAKSALHERPLFSMALAGGSTPREIYRRLAASDELDWSRIQVFWGDERAVPPDDPNSNYRMAREALLDHVAIPPAQVHRMPAERDDLDDAARTYERRLVEVLGSPPRLDLVLLGLGTDAHTASLFPGEAAVREQTRLVLSTPAPVIAPRLTLTPPALNAARHVLFLVTGYEKRQALRRVWDGPREPDVVPAQVVEPPDGDVIWLIDREAAWDERLR